MKRKLIFEFNSKILFVIKLALAKNFLIACSMFDKQPNNNLTFYKQKRLSKQIKKLSKLIFSEKNFKFRLN